MNKLPVKAGVGIVVIFHLIGLVGILSPYRALFVSLTPVNLLLCLALILYFEPRPWTSSFIYLSIFTALAGFALEVIGVNTGVPFGAYAYGPPFGWQWLNTPFLIGINWLLMVYGGVNVMMRYIRQPVWGALATGLLVMFVDLLLEPVAIRLDYWTWESPTVPIQNYLTWFAAIAVFAYLWYRRHGVAKNEIAAWVLVTQVVFFALLNLGPGMLG